MSILKGRPDAGQGGKRGHSNMDHWEFTEEIKLAARKRRRQEAKRAVKEALKELADKEASNVGVVGSASIPSCLLTLPSDF
jgi:hypothetical protein